MLTIEQIDLAITKVDCRIVRIMCSHKLFCDDELKLLEKLKKDLIRLRKDLENYLSKVGAK